MNLKATVAIVVAALIVGIIAWSNVYELASKRFEEGSLDNYHIVQSGLGRFVLLEKKVEKSPWFYQVAEDDIRTIGVSYLDDKSVSFYKTENRTWAFTDPGGYSAELHSLGRHNSASKRTWDEARSDGGAAID